MTAAVAVDAAGNLQLDYRLSALPEVLRQLAIPASCESSAADGLWQHTCCEAFVAAVDADDYHEFNFSPSTCWAAYRFTAYRERDPDWCPPASPTIHWTAGPDGLQLTACLPVSLLPASSRLALGLTAVIETEAGEKSYWAVRHAGERPDFHLRDSFIVTLE